MAGLLRQESFSRDRFLASLAIYVRDFLKVSKYGKVEFAWTGAVL